MAEVYFKLIKAGRRIIDQVPDHLKEEVQEMLDAEQSAL